MVCSIWNKFTVYKLWQKLLHLRMKEAQEQGREVSEEQRKRNLPVSSDPESEALMSSTTVMIAPFHRPPLPSLEDARRKRPPRRLSQRPNDIYVTRKSEFGAQLARCSKLLDQGWVKKLDSNCVGCNKG